VGEVEAWFYTCTYRPGLIPKDSEFDDRVVLYMLLMGVRVEKREWIRRWDSIC